MKRPYLAVLLAAMAVAAMGHDFRAGDIVVDHPYALVGGSSVYFRTLRNKGTRPERLLGASSSTVGRVWLLHDGRQASLILPAGAEVELRHTGSWRLQLVDLNSALKLGDTIAVTLRFEHAGDVLISAGVVDATARRSR